jgi:hypothetical protein
MHILAVSACIREFVISDRPGLPLLRCVILLACRSLKRLRAGGTKSGELCVLHVQKFGLVDGQKSANTPAGRDV